MNRESAIDLASSLETYLEPRVLGSAAARAHVAGALREGRLVVIRSALQTSFAERMFRCLNEFSDWKLYETYSRDRSKLSGGDPFNYHHHNIYDKSLYPSDLAMCQRIFSSEGTRGFMKQLSGQDCSGGTSFSASWYQPGDHSLPHNDRVPIGDGQQVRTVAFVWHLTKDWRPEWGGALYWCAKNRYVLPSFNTLSLFVVTNDSTHFVTHVSPHAAAKRLSINGWWSGRKREQDAAPEDSTGDAGTNIEVI